MMLDIVLMMLFHIVQGENVIKEIFPKKVAELNALLEVLFVLWSSQYIIYHHRYTVGGMEVATASTAAKHWW